MQESGGVILSMWRFLIRKPIDTFFGSILFPWQLIFLVWTYVFDRTRRVMIRIITATLIFLSIYYGWEWYYLFLWVTAWIIYALVPGRVPLWLILKAAGVTHIRLCLERIENTNRWRYISQSAPNAKHDEWDDSQLLGKNFVYMPPGFIPTIRFIAAMIEYAQKHVNDRGKRGYDYLQLFSIALNSILFWWIPGLHGNEVIKFMNLPGFKEVCSTLVAAILRWSKFVEIMKLQNLHINNELQIADGFVEGYYKDHQADLLKFFGGYVTSMIFPGLYPVIAYLHGTWELPPGWIANRN